MCPYPGSGKSPIFGCHFENLIGGDFERQMAQLWERRPSTLLGHSASHSERLFLPPKRTRGNTAEMGWKAALAKAPASCPQARGFGDVRGRPAPLLSCVLVDAEATEAGQHFRGR
jgi:hypothetical protein